MDEEVLAEISQISFASSNNPVKMNQKLVEVGISCDSLFTTPGSVFNNVSQRAISEIIGYCLTMI